MEIKFPLALLSGSRQWNAAGMNASKQPDWITFIKPSSIQSIICRVVGGLVSISSSHQAKTGVQVTNLCQIEEHTTPHTHTNTYTFRIGFYITVWFMSSKFFPTLFQRSLLFSVSALFSHSTFVAISKKIWITFLKLQNKLLLWHKNCHVEK